ncbi:MAG: hypothetical protein HAW61_00680 [Candidatus Portiera sp.]|nr:hypothetical protein [Portiera sp.]
MNYSKYCLLFSIFILASAMLISCSSIPKSKVKIPGFESQTPRGKSNTQTHGIDLKTDDAYKSIAEIVNKKKRKSNGKSDTDEAGPLEEILLLEIQASRGEYVLETIEGMIAHAELYSNEEVAQRAYELSTIIYDQRVAKDIARRWYSIATSSDAAQKSYIQQLIISSDYELAFEIIANRVDQGKSADFISIARYYQVVDEEQANDLITFYNRYLRIYPDKKSNLNAGGMLARYKLAHFLFYQKRYTKSLNLINLILAKQIKGLNLSQQATEMKARIYYLTERPNGESFYKQATRKFPRSYPTHIYYALYLLYQDKPKQAEAFLLSWAKKRLTTKDDLYKLLTLGIGAYKVSFNNLYEYVVSTIDKHSPADSLFISGAMAFAIGDLTGTEALLTRVQQGSPLLTSAFSIRLKNALSVNEFEAAEDLLEEISSYNWQAYIFFTGQYAIELIHKGQSKRAKQVITAMSKRFKKDPDVIEALAYVYYEMGDISAMSREYDKALRIHPDSHAIQNSYGYSLADRNVQLNKAQKLINAAIKTEPTSPAYVDSLGWLNYKKGKLQEAKYLLEWAYRRKIDPEIATHLGEVLWQNGQKQRARYLWLLNSELNPDSRVLNETIKRHGIDRSFLTKDSYFFRTDFLE